MSQTLGHTEKGELTIELPCYGSERVRDVTPLEQAALRKIARDDYLVGGFVAHLLRQMFTDDVGQTTSEESIADHIALGAHYATALRNLVEASKWPINYTPEGFFADALEPWLASEDVSRITMVGNISVRQYLESPDA